MTPIIAIVERTNSGKTTLIETLVPALSSGGYRAATIKRRHRGRVRAAARSADLALLQLDHVPAGAAIAAPRHSDLARIGDQVAQRPFTPWKMSTRGTKGSPRARSTSGLLAKQREVWA